MATLSDEDVARVVQALEGRGYEVRKRDAPQGQSRVILEEKHFRRIEKFSGDQSQWQKWLFNLCVAVSAISRDCVLAMEAVVKNANVTLDPKEVSKLVGAEVMAKFAHELFTVLCTLTGAEANIVVRSTVQKGLG